VARPRWDWTKALAPAAATLKQSAQFQQLGPAEAVYSRQLRQWVVVLLGSKLHHLEPCLWRALALCNLTPQTNILHKVSIARGLPYTRAHRNVTHHLQNHPVLGNSSTSCKWPTCHSVYRPRRSHPKQLAETMAATVWLRPGR